MSANLDFSKYIVPAPRGSTGIDRPKRSRDFGPDQIKVARRIYEVGRERNEPDDHIRAALSAGIVESDYRPSAIGDNGTAFGVFQQRKAGGYDTQRAHTDLDYAANAFYDNARGVKSYRTPGHLAARVQNPRKDLRGRYDQELSRADELFRRFGSGPDFSKYIVNAPDTPDFSKYVVEKPATTPTPTTALPLPTNAEVATRDSSTAPQPPPPTFTPQLSAPTGLEAKAQLEELKRPGVRGLIEPGNVEVMKRPVVRNRNGSISTVRSMSANIDGREVLLPTVSDGGRILTNEQAVEEYKRTGKHLGIFETPEAATEYAKGLHEQQAQTYAPPQTFGRQVVRPLRRRAEPAASTAQGAGIQPTQAAQTADVAPGAYRTGLSGEQRAMEAVTGSGRMTSRGGTVRVVVTPRMSAADISYAAHRDLAARRGLDPADADAYAREVVGLQNRGGFFEHGDEFVRKARAGGMADVDIADPTAVTMLNRRLAAKHGGQVYGASMGPGPEIPALVRGVESAFDSDKAKAFGYDGAPSGVVGVERGVLSTAGMGAKAAEKAYSLLDLLTLRQWNFGGHAEDARRNAEYWYNAVADLDAAHPTDLMDKLVGEAVTLPIPVAKAKLAGSLLEAAASRIGARVTPAAVGGLLGIFDTDPNASPAEAVRHVVESGLLFKSFELTQGLGRAGHIAAQGALGGAQGYLNEGTSEGAIKGAVTQAGFALADPAHAERTADEGTFRNPLSIAQELRRRAATPGPATTPEAPTSPRVASMSDTDLATRIEQLAQRPTKGTPARRRAANQAELDTLLTEASRRFARTAQRPVENEPLSSDVPTFKEFVEEMQPRGGIRFETLSPGEPLYAELKAEYDRRYGSTEAARPVSEAQSAQEAATVETPKPVRQRFQHRDFGLVEVSDNQSGVPRGRVRVVATSEGSEHVIQKANGRGEGNALAVPVRETQVETLREVKPAVPTVKADASARLSDEAIRSIKNFTGETVDPAAQAILHSPHKDKILAEIGDARAPEQAELGQPLAFVRPDGSRVLVRLTTKRGLEPGDKMYGEPQTNNDPVLAIRHEGLRIPEEVDATAQNVRGGDAPQVSDRVPQVVERTMPAQAAAAETVAAPDRLNAPIPETDGLLPVKDATFPDLVSSDSTKADYLAREHLRRFGGTNDVRHLHDLTHRYYEKLVAEQYPDVARARAGKQTRQSQSVEVKMPNGATPEAQGEELTPHIAERSFPQSAEPTGIKNAQVEAERGSPVEIEGRRSFGQAWEAAKGRIERGEIDPASLAKEIVAKPRPLSAEESAALVHDRARIHNAHRAVMDEITKAQESGDEVAETGARARLKEIEEAKDSNDRAARASGYEQGLGLAARRIMAKEDYSLAQLVQRAKVAKGGEVPAEVRTKLESLSKQIEEMEMRLQQRDEAYARLKTEKGLRKIQREVGVESRRARRTTDRKELDDEYASLKADFAAARAEVKGVQPSGLAGLDPEGKLSGLVLKMAKNRVRAGVNTIEGLVDEIYSVLKEHVEGLTKRDIRDVISGYGETSQLTKDDASVRLRELKRQMRLASAIEDAESGRRPAKSGLQREADSRRVQSMRRELRQAVKNAGLEAPRLPVQRPTVVDLGPKQGPRLSDARKEGPKLSEGTGRKEGPRLTEAPLQGPKDWLPGAKRHLQSQIDSLESQIRSGEFAKPKSRAPLVYDTEGEALKVGRDRLKRQADAEIRRLERENRTGLQRTADFMLKFRRAVLLSSVKTLGKLTAAASGRAVTTPLEEGIGTVLSKAPGIRRISEMAPREGKGSLTAERAATSAMLSRGMLREAKETLTGEGGLAVRFGGGVAESPELIDLFGRIHGALKTPAKYSEFFRAVEKRSTFERREAIKRGMTPTDADAHLQRPEIQAAILGKSYEDASRAILMNDNGAVSFYRMGLKFAESRGGAGKAVSKGMQFMLPIVKVPTNYVFESTSYAVGGGKALASVIWNKGVKTPEQADYVMRTLKKQGVGAALLVVGYLNADNIGGYYQPGDSKDEKKPKAGTVRVFGYDMPRWLMHTPALEMLQVGATIRRVKDREAKKRGDSPLASGAEAAGWGLAEEIPFIGTPLRTAETLKHGGGFSRFLGENARSMVVPPDVQTVAREGLPFTHGTLGDVDSQGKPVKRYPRGVIQTIQEGVPIGRRYLSDTKGDSGGGRPAVSRPSNPRKSEERDAKPRPTPTPNNR